MKKLFEEPIVNVIVINDVITDDNDTSNVGGGGFRD